MNSMKPGMSYYDKILEEERRSSGPRPSRAYLITAPTSCRPGLSVSHGEPRPFPLVEVGHEGVSGEDRELQPARARDV